MQGIVGFAIGLAAMVSFSDFGGYATFEFLWLKTNSFVPKL